MNVMPKWLQKYLGAHSAEQVKAAVHNAEVLTTGEIVPMIVRRSAATGHVPMIAGLYLLIVVLIGELTGLGLGSFEFHPLIVFALGASALMLGAVAANAPFVQRLLTAKPDRIGQVEQRARIEFESARLYSTKERTGILLFVSLMERHAVVLADHGISSKLQPGVWDEVLELLIKGIKQGDMGRGYVDAIDKCGSILATHFPPGTSNPNELDNKLIWKE